MSKLSPAEIAQHAYDAGFRGDALTTAVAVALAESGGDPRAHNDTYPDNSYGLWQINMLGSLQEPRQDQFGIESNRELFKPGENAEAAKHIFDDAGGSWRPWSTYTNGAYRQHLDEARKAVGRVDENGGKDGDKDRDDRKSDGKGGSGRDTAASLLGSGKGGYRVDPDALEAFGRRGHRVSDELRILAKEEISDLRRSAEGFGKAGQESGFADALQEFSGALRHQVRTLSSRTDHLAAATRRVARAYRKREDETKQDMDGKRPEDVKAPKVVATGGGED